MPDTTAAWALATLEDVEAFSFLEFPDAELEASPHALGSIYEKELASEKVPSDTATGRVLSMLA